MSLDNRPAYSGGCQCGAVRYHVAAVLDTSRRVAVAAPVAKAARLISVRVATCLKVMAFLG